ncbi:hypothetical protein EJB05_16623 [Eragrostis curvula]|uniref:Uncharacterized protein n=1 Tax=Eragrostis curvula TaxID=38414 RepID=A0A5J9VIB9_9POAL|nr:hypothetical protein EJB05_16590 [Eragrostis curvula]TVU34772.1 hypothetical protein EJB05_16623 [Eragrostis curvula]
MAPAAMAAPVASVSPRSAAFAPGGGVRSGARICLPQRHAAKVLLPPNELRGSVTTQRRRLVLRSSTSDSQATTKQEKAPFGYTRKDVLLIGVGVTLFGVGLKSGLELLGVDPLQAGNVVQLLVVLGMTVGWISTYMFRVANKDMTYAHQLRDYEKQVMEKRLESLSEAELQALLEQVEEEKQRMPAIPEEPNAITFKKN